MPEGPEIRREADRIARALVGHEATEVWFAFVHLREWCEVLPGRRVTAVEPRGKALLTRFEGGVSVYSHNQLYGRWFVRKRGELPKTARQLRFAVHTAARSALLYSASEIDVLYDEQLTSHPFLQKLGPDVLAPGVGGAAVRRRLEQPQFRGRSLGALLLDQGFVCGLGNYLRSEILFVAGVDAGSRPKDLSPASLAALADTIVSIARRAYRSGGVTNDLDAARRLKADGVPRASYRHWVFARAGKPCRACGVIVRRRESAGRRLYWCPACQAS